MLKQGNTIADATESKASLASRATPSKTAAPPTDKTMLLALFSLLTKQTVSAHQKGIAATQYMCRVTWDRAVKLAITNYDMSPEERDLIAATVSSSINSINPVILTSSFGAWRHYYYSSHELMEIDAAHDYTLLAWIETPIVQMPLRFFEIDQWVATVSQVAPVVWADGINARLSNRFERIVHQVHRGLFDEAREAMIAETKSRPNCLLKDSWYHVWLRPHMPDDLIHVAIKRCLPEWDEPHRVTWRLTNGHIRKVSVWDYYKLIDFQHKNLPFGAPVDIITRCKSTRISDDFNTRVPFVFQLLQSMSSAAAGSNSGCTCLDLMYHRAQINQNRSYITLMLVSALPFDLIHMLLDTSYNSTDYAKHALFGGVSLARDAKVRADFITFDSAAIMAILLVRRDVSLKRRVSLVRSLLPKLEMNDSSYACLYSIPLAFAINLSDDHNTQQQDGDEVLRQTDNNNNNNESIVVPGQDRKMGTIEKPNTETKGVAKLFLEKQETLETPLFVKDPETFAYRLVQQVYEILKHQLHGKNSTEIQLFILYWLSCFGPGNLSEFIGELLRVHPGQLSWATDCPHVFDGKLLRHSGIISATQYDVMSPFCNATTRVYRNWLDQLAYIIKSDHVSYGCAITTNIIKSMWQVDTTDLAVFYNETIATADEKKITQIASSVFYEPPAHTIVFSSPPASQFYHWCAKVSALATWCGRTSLGASQIWTTMTSSATGQIASVLQWFYSEYGEPIGLPVHQHNRQVFFHIKRLLKPRIEQLWHFGRDESVFPCMYQSWKLEPADFSTLISYCSGFEHIWDLKELHPPHSSELAATTAAAASSQNLDLPELWLLLDRIDLKESQHNLLLLERAFIIMCWRHTDPQNRDPYNKISKAAKEWWIQVRLDYVRAVQFKSRVAKFQTRIEGAPNPLCLVSNQGYLKEAIEELVQITENLKRIGQFN